MNNPVNATTQILAIYGAEGIFLTEAAAACVPPGAAITSVTSDEAVAKKVGASMVPEFLALMKDMESKPESVESVFLVGSLLTFATESNIRYLLAAAFLHARTEVIVIERTGILMQRWATICRVAMALDLGLPTVRSVAGQASSVLAFVKAEVKNRYLSVHEIKGLTSLVMPAMLPAEDAVALAGAAAHAKQGFSLIRMGHCENRLFGYGFTYGWSDVKETYGIQFGRELSDSDTNVIAEGVRAAVRNADVVGVPRINGFGASKLKVFENSTYVHLRSFSAITTKKFTNVNIHLQFFFKQAFGDFLRQFEEISVIGSRDVDDVLRRSLGVRVRSFKIPTEFKFAGEALPVQHFPTVYHSLLDELSTKVQPGDVFIIGAGVLGKIYCDAVKRRGGVAIDVGSLMDALVNLHTRGSGFEPVEWVQGAA